MKLSHLYLAITALCLFCSCQSIDTGVESEEISASSDGFAINTSMTQNDVWTVNMPAVHSKAGETTTLFYSYYFFDSDGKALFYGGKAVSESSIKSNYSGSFNKIKSVGSYTCYGMLNIATGEYTKPTEGVTTPSDVAVTLKAPRDLCLGSKTFVVKADSMNYSVNVTVSHVMAKLALVIKSVPADITSMVVSLPQESNTCNFKGEFSGSSTADTLSIARTKNSDGTYDWSINGSNDEELVYPCTLSEMPIIIVASDEKKKYTYNTTSSVVCSSGTRSSLSTTWETVTNTEMSTTVNPWTGTQTSGSFDMGNATVTNK